MSAFNSTAVRGSHYRLKRNLTPLSVTCVIPLRLRVTIPFFRDYDRSSIQISALIQFLEFFKGLVGQ